MRILVRLSIAIVTLAGVLGSLQAGIPKKEDVAKQIATLKNSASGKARADAAEELGRIGAIKADLVTDAIDPFLMTLVKDKEMNVRRAAALALGRIALEPAKAVPALTKAIDDPAPAVKIGAIDALGLYGPQAKDALPTLRKLAQDMKDKKLSRAARVAIKMIQPKN